MAVYARVLLVGLITGYWAFQLWLSGLTAIRVGLFFFLIHSSIVFLMLGVMMMLQVGDEVVGKDRKTGQVPVWSLISFAPFHSLNYLLVRMKNTYLLCRGYPQTNKVSDNLYVGNLFSQDWADANGVKWRAVVDLTTEFSERCRCEHYLNIPVHDGNPPSSAQFAEAVLFVKDHIEQGPVLIHCAYGVGRSSTVAAACVLGLGRQRGALKAFESVKAGRPVARLNTRMQLALLKFEKDVLAMRPADAKK